MKRAHMQLSGTFSSASYPWTHNLAKNLCILCNFPKEMRRNIPLPLVIFHPFWWVTPYWSVVNLSTWWHWVRVTCSWPGLPHYLPSLFWERINLSIFLPCSLSSEEIEGSAMPKCLRLVVVGGSCVGKTAVIEQAVFGNHSPGQVSEHLNFHQLFILLYSNRTRSLATELRR